MGLRFLKRSEQMESSNPRELDRVSERYNAYFPRLFAYVHSCVGGDIPTQDIIVQAFSRAFQRAGNAGEDGFRTVLFRTARRLCHPTLKHYRPDHDDSLNTREREVVSLVFDAGLTRIQIAHLFRIRETTIGSLLMTGLNKLKKQTSPAAATANPRPA